MLVFTSEGVGIGVVIRRVELYDLVKMSSVLILPIPLATPSFTIK